MLSGVAETRERWSNTAPGLTKLLGLSQTGTQEVFPTQSHDTGSPVDLRYWERGVRTLLAESFC